jgi:hypothetical protein
MTIEKLITDEAINLVFANTNFGSETPRETIADTLYKVDAGYSTGRTACVCCSELGLINSTSPGRYTVTYLGREYLKLLAPNPHKQQ